jgi:hypothetical protein
VVRLPAVDGATLETSGVDLLDGTPVLDIKPYVPEFDAIPAERTGWLAHAAARVHDTRADAPFRPALNDRRSSAVRHPWSDCMGITWAAAKILAFAGGVASARHTGPTRRLATSLQRSGSILRADRAWTSVPGH